MKAQLRAQGTILLVCSLLLLLSAMYLASSRSLSSTLEGESAEIAREFLEGPSRVVNHLNGKEDLDKPPLYYWIIALVSRVVPSWEMAARLPSLVSILIIALAIYLVRDPSDSPVLFPLICFILITSPKVLIMSQTARMDMLFTAACFGSIIAFYHFWKRSGETEIQYGSPIGFFILSASAVMMKGPVGAILTFCPVTIFVCLERKWRQLRGIFLGRGILLFLVLTVPWFLAASIATDFRFFHRFILEENLSRFTSLIPGGTFKDFSHHPMNRYFLYFLTGFFPWSLISPFWVYDMVRNWKRKNSKAKLLFIYFSFVFIFFTLAISKRSDYILPLYPAAAILTGIFILDSDKRWRIEVPFLTFFTLVFVVASLLSIGGIILVWKGPEGLPHFVYKLKKIELYGSILAKYPFVLVALIVISIVNFLGLISKWINPYKSQGISIISPFSIAMTVSLGLFVTALLGTIYKEKDMRPFCVTTSVLIKDCPLYYWDFWDEECTFYLHRKIDPIYSRAKLWDKLNSDKKIFLIIREEDLARLNENGISFPFICKKNSPPLRPLLLVSNKSQ